MSLAKENDELRRWVHVIEVTESMGDLLKVAGLSKDRMQGMMEKSSDPPFVEAGSADKVDNNTLRVLLYKLVKATRAKDDHWAALFGCEPCRLTEVLDTIREQVENETE